MVMVKFSPSALNFDYDFVLLVHFFGTRCTNSIFYFSIKRRLVVVIHSFIVSSLWLMYKGIYAYKVQLWQRNCHNHDFKALIILNWLRCLTKLYLPMLSIVHSTAFVNNLSNHQIVALKVLSWPTLLKPDISGFYFESCLWFVLPSSNCCCGKLVDAPQVRYSDTPNHYTPLCQD